jgi:hypothetical protein
LTSKNTNQLFAVEEMEVVDEVLELHYAGVPATKISKILKGKGKDISPSAIIRWLKAKQEEVTARKQIESRQKYEVMVNNYEEEVEQILDEVKEIKNRVVEENDIKMYDKMVGRLYQGIELLAKLRGDVKTGNQVNIQMIFNEISEKSFDKYKGTRDTIHGYAETIDIEATVKKEDKEISEGLKRNG